ncbi:hypothetical protein BWI17_15075 [Betaproteobacteria bacterium GR16-43]|nr:hypothetical protein BWI17_15075 [Betaproteobacteria bacterium GR16-43]
MLGKFLRIASAPLIGIGGFVLSMGWTMGPQQLIDDARFAKLTTKVEARVVDRWLAVEWKPGDEAKAPDWRNVAKATACAVVEYEGDWGNQRRAFCGTRLPFRPSFGVTDLDQLAPGVPFSWSRDASGIAVPEVRVAGATKVYLERAKPSVPAFPNTATARNALELLQFEIQSPVAATIRGWTSPEPTMRVAIDPADPANAMPAGFLERPPKGAWIYATIFCAVFGGVFYWVGMSLLLANLPFVTRILMTVIPLLALPWWGEYLPKAIARLHEDFGEVIEDMLGDVDRLGRLVSSDPGEALLANGERLAWAPGGPPYDKTFGLLKIAPPAQAFSSGDAALATLNGRVSEQVRAWPDEQRAEVFVALKSEKVRSLYGAGYAFLPAAAEALSDPRASDATKAAARAFLSEWVTQPVDEPWPRDPARKQRIALYRDLQKIPVNVIANPAGWIADRAEQRR